MEADYRGRGRYYPGTISRDRGDETYDIDCAAAVSKSFAVPAIQDVPTQTMMASAKLE